MRRGRLSCFSLKTDCGAPTCRSRNGEEISMRKGLKKCLCLTLAVLMAASFTALVGAEKTEVTQMTVPVWQRGDIVLHSEKQYDNPYTDVDVDAVFVHESGDEIRLYGFWNGGDEWRVRFAPTRTGEWTYAVTCSDPEKLTFRPFEIKTVRFVLQEKRC